MKVATLVVARPELPDCSYASCVKLPPRRIVSFFASTPMAPISSSAATLVVAVLPLSGVSLVPVPVDVRSAPPALARPLTLATFIA